MESKSMKTGNDGPENNQAAEEEAPHGTHTFEFHTKSGTKTSITCAQAGTIEDSLKRSSQFRKFVRNQKNKDVVILRDGRAISLHCPCSLIKNECLNVKTVKNADRPKQQGCGSAPPRRMGLSGDLVMFNVLTKGGKGVVRIMTNPALKDVVQELAVHAYKGETVKQALRRDGRFLKTAFQNKCALSDLRTEVNTEMLNLVDDLDGKTFRIICIKKSNQSNSQSSSLESNDVYDENQDHLQESSTSEPNSNETVASTKILSEIPHSHKLLKGKKKKKGISQRSHKNLLVEFGQNAGVCVETKTMMKLMKLSESVCQVRIDGNPSGSGFLLFDKFVQTNAHVITDIFDQKSGQLNKRATVQFSFESLNTDDELVQKFVEVEVEEVAGFERGPDVSGHLHDWALLKLRADQTLPNGLLKDFGFPPPKGVVRIIGYPNGGPRNIDTCIITPDVSYSGKENQGHTQLIAHNYSKIYSFQIPHALFYWSCLYFGSSGSPVFDKYGKVVAMHSGGFPSIERGEQPTEIEFGYPLSGIIEHLIIQLVETQRFDVLKTFLACEFEHSQNMMNNVKKLVSSRNLQAFKIPAGSGLFRNDDRLKKFFEFFSQTEDVVPMDTTQITPLTIDKRY
ncbi:protein FAM111A-like [Echeneis naucrates]|uniref:Protein FAM111A-like n=1 Tax=Echeneis naucrates TaxID=173247 RepID=A0A665TYM9_ECHNA|nr:protein FAM111A-like [Echeneis naucrates]XP_029375204.1 protein FAM111A-like [Echeneis naucrates]XP_029375205.1 protein FAM111A-like [Echeneis naucrates]